MKKCSKKDRITALAREYIHLSRLISEGDKDFTENAKAKLDELTFVVDVLDLNAEFYNAVFAEMNEYRFSDNDYRGKEQIKNLTDIIKPFGKFDVRQTDYWLDEITAGFTNTPQEYTYLYR